MRSQDHADREPRLAQPTGSASSYDHRVHRYQSAGKRVPKAHRVAIAIQSMLHNPQRVGWDVRDQLPFSVSISAMFRLWVRSAADSPRVASHRTHHALARVFGNLVQSQVAGPVRRNARCDRCPPQTLAIMCPCNVFLLEAVWWAGTGALAIVAVAAFMAQR